MRETNKKNFIYIKIHFLLLLLVLLSFCFLFLDELTLFLAKEDDDDVLSLLFESLNTILLRESIFSSSWNASLTLTFVLADVYLKKKKSIN